MRIGLIAMSGVRVRTKELAELGVTLPGFVNRGKVIASLPSLGLLTVAALTPPDVEVEYIEFDEVPEADGDLPMFDLVGLSSFTARIDATYALADRYRAMGVPVVLGGLHVTLMPDEAQAHADAIVLDGAEGAWPELVRDFQAGCMKPRYRGLKKDVFKPENYVEPRFDLLKGRPYNRVTVQTSRGCPINCEFCAASIRITSSFQQKPVERVISELRAVTEVVDLPFVEFADDNTFVNKKWGKALLREMAPLNLKWFTETDITVADDPELLDLMAKAGCRQILIGLESPSASGLRGIDPHDWKARRFDTYLEAIARIQAAGISVNGTFVLGLDSHTPDIFAELRDFVRASNLLEVQLTVQTPFPGTPLYARLKQTGRLLTDRFWDRCTLFDVNYRPLRMSVDALESGFRWLAGEVYNEREFNRRKRHYMDLTRARSAPQPFPMQLSA
ncbi:B12-binding domain-containing radical SAM protein [Ovoidimarina sediminis]|uniref:B12-binding domain-containing radical SAM protein n=1 Tax=Ovoidimarina sediminis TaxID=3079856 RepID=UPI0029113A2B|nr:radical SAM protein [Rhodophyticola sp. MJ-SS7]MDU8945749.1 radical SAM protein [Rhodophyticola sp. MJ-SS7]